MDKLGTFIKNEREKRNLSIRQFAKLCNLSNTYIGNIEKSKDPRTNNPIYPTIDSLVKISEALGFTLEDFLKKTGYIPRNESDEMNNMNKFYFEVNKEAFDKGLSPEELKVAMDFYLSVVDKVKAKEEKKKKKKD